MKTLTAGLAGILIGCVSLATGVAAEPSWFFDGTHRYMRLSLEDFGKVHLQIRTVGAPGSASQWLADGGRVENEIVFARSVGDNEPRGTFYVASASEASVRVKVKPGQEKEKVDEGVVGVYHHITEERRLALARKEAEGAEKRLRDAERPTAKKWGVLEKPALTEWTARWPGLRERLLALRDRYRINQMLTQKTAKPALGEPAETPPEKQPDHWFLASEIAGAGLAFLTTPLDAKTADGWDGIYNDGFGGTADLTLSKDGTKVRFTLNYTRGTDEQAGLLAGDAILGKGAEEQIADFVEKKTGGHGTGDPGAHSAASRGTLPGGGCGEDGEVCQAGMVPGRVPQATAAAVKGRTGGKNRAA